MKYFPRARSAAAKKKATEPAETATREHIFKCLTFVPTHWPIMRGFEIGFLRIAIDSTSADCDSFPKKKRKEKKNTRIISGLSKKSIEL